MRRLAALAAVAVCALAAAAFAAGAGSSDSGGYRVDAIFDNAGFLIPGQDVKIAGAKAGEVVDISLTRERKARIEMKVDPEFAPFRSDADCTIQPQSIIGEKFIQCMPGTPRGRSLRGKVHTVPLANTHAPIDADLVFATFRAPTPERLRIVVAELGGGLAGRGEDLNAIIRRANPALQESRRVLRILEEDKEKLRAIAGEAERVLGVLSRERRPLVSAVGRLSRVTTTTATRRRELDQTVARVPGLLREADPVIDSLAALSRAGAPVARDLERAAPRLVQLAGRLGPLADAARPALDRLGTAARTGAPVLRRSRPVVDDLRTFAGAARPTGALLRPLLESLRDRGVVEGLQDFVYFAALATARFDQYSHIVPAHLIGAECTTWARTPTPGCNANFSEPRAGGLVPTPKRASARAGRTKAREARPEGRSPGAGAAAEQLLDYLVGP